MSDEQKKILAKRFYFFLTLVTTQSRAEFEEAYILLTRPGFSHEGRQEAAKNAANALDRYVRPKEKYIKLK